MKILLTGLAVVGLTACAQQPSLHLSEMPPLAVEVFAYAYSPRVETGASKTVAVFARAVDGSCPRISDDVIATLDGQPMKLETAGGTYDDFSGSGCDPIYFWIENFTVQAGTISQLVIREGTTTWTIEAADLMTSDFSLAGTVDAGQHVAVTWESADAMSAGSYGQLTTATGEVTWTTAAYDLDADREAATIHDNVIELDLPATINAGDVLTVASGRTATPVTCEGPAGCAISVSASADFSR